MIILLATILTLCKAYDESLANKLWALTSASYCAPDQLETWSCGKLCVSGVEDVIVFLNSTLDNAGFAAYANQQIVLVFRGTLPWNIVNWIEDIDFIKTYYPYCPNDCQVHRGFFYSYQGIQEQVITGLKFLKSKYPSAQITITGHSLGGALATHAFVHLSSNGIKIDNFYTFGSPRVGDKAFSTWFSSRYTQQKFRITHARDPVVHLPHSSDGFQHLPTEAYYKRILLIEKPVKICNDAAGEDKTCANENLIDGDIHDHLNYLQQDNFAAVLACQ